jgi:hypothetical protein
MATAWRGGHGKAARDVTQLYQDYPWGDGLRDYWYLAARARARAGASHPLRNLQMCLQCALVSASTQRGSPCLIRVLNARAHSCISIKVCATMCSTMCPIKTKVCSTMCSAQNSRRVQLPAFNIPGVTNPARRIFVHLHTLCIGPETGPTVHTSVAPVCSEDLAQKRAETVLNV